MEITLKPELQERLDQIASQTGRTAGQVVQQLVEEFLDHDQWFRGEVQKGLKQLDEGAFILHDDLVAQIKKTFT